MTGSVIRAKDIGLAIATAVDIGLEHTTVYAHEGAMLDAAADSMAREEGVQVVFVKEDGCGVAGRP